MQQYQMIRGSRGVVLSFAEEHLAHQLHTPVPAFVNKTIAYLLVHNINVYLHWMANFAMQLGEEYADENSFQDIAGIKVLYAKTDRIVADFIMRYHNGLHETIIGTTISGRQEQLTPLEIFTHVITHEFHHKGQLLSMFRLLGQTPPDSDVIRF